LTKLYTTAIFTHTHIQPFSTLDLHKVSALGSRVGWTPASNNEHCD